MKKVLIPLCIAIILPLVSMADYGSTNNKRKGKKTGAYTTACHSKSKDYNKKKFKLAEALKSNNKKRSTANTKKMTITN